MSAYFKKLQLAFRKQKKIRDCEGQKIFVQKKPPDKWCGIAELPSNNIAPLIKFQRKISMPPYPLRIIRIHYCLTCRTDGDWYFQI